MREEHTETSPIWVIFGDLMAGVVGLMVLMLVWTLTFQVDLQENLKREETRRVEEQDRRIALEQALERPLAEGLITLNEGTIGIRGSVLFALNSSMLEPEGSTLLKELAIPLEAYLAGADELIMISGFTDDLVIHKENYLFKDNWELSAQRALTVTRSLVGNGLPPKSVFAAAFGAFKPVVPNDSENNRALNRRVEIAPVPRTKRRAIGEEVR
ncbi:MAG: OmpA family protein [Myxococcota bacterium]|nr:OmpA family protein [Myxococcota bacterium]